MSNSLSMFYGNYFVSWNWGLGGGLQFLSNVEATLLACAVRTFFFSSSRIHELLSRLLQSPPRNLWISFPIGWFSNSLSSLIRQLDCERGDQMWWQICLIPLKLIQFKMGNTADYCVTDKDTWIALCTRHKLYTYNLYSYTHEKKKIIQQWTLLCHWGIGSTAGWKV